jgi:hypothetical protein
MQYRLFRAAMRSAFPFFALSFLLLVASATLAQVDAGPAGPAVDAELESSLTGSSVRLSSTRSRVMVVFYEDRAHIPDNEETKGLLGRFIADNHLETRLAMLPIANADGFHYAPVDSLVRSGLAEGARRIGLDIWIDWDRHMYAAPISCVAGASNVLVIDRAGVIQYRHAGVLGEADRTELFRAVRRSLH